MRTMKDSGVEWLGEVPAGWLPYRLKNLYRVVSYSGYPDEELLSVYLNRGVIRYADSTGMQVHKPSESLEKYQLVQPGNLVLNNQQAWRGSVGVSFFRGIVSPAYHILEKTVHELNNRYMNYLFRGPFVSEFEMCSQGVGTIQRNISVPKVLQERVFLPELSEQARIADFLDAKCAEVDRAVSAAEQSIQEYKAYKNSVVFQAVTKGLNPDVPMKDSGVEWLGEIPSTWDLRQAGQLAEQTKTPNEGMTETNLLSLSYGKVKRRDINATDGLLPASFETYNVIESDDIVLRFTDLQNDQKSLRVGRATERGIITSAYVTVRPHDPSCSRFIYYALHAYDLRKGFYGMGAGVRQGLKWQEAKYIVIPWPSSVEQEQICDFLNEKSVAIDDVIDEKENIIEELKAYKKSLIYEVVTGKREVR